MTINYQVPYPLYPDWSDQVGSNDKTRNVAMSEMEQPEMVQRVADALRAACLKEFGATWSYDRAWAFARAAIAATREPTEAMLTAGANARMSPVSTHLNASSSWYAMIDVALGKPPA